MFQTQLKVKLILTYFTYFNPKHNFIFLLDISMLYGRNIFPYPVNNSCNKITVHLEGLCKILNLMRKLKLFLKNVDLIQPLKNQLPHCMSAISE